MTKQEFVEKYIKEQKEKKQKREIDINDYMAISCRRASKIKNYGRCKGQI